MSLRDLPLPSVDFSREPYRNWMTLAQDYQQCTLLDRALFGIPEPWVRWADAVARARERRGSLIRSPLEYRLARLHDGMVLLQEAKYICDLVENVLRQVVVSHCTKQEITWEELRLNVRGIDKLELQALRNGIQQARHEAPTLDFLLQATFYQTEHIAASCWTSFPVKRKAAGFRTCFFHDRRCRESAVFVADMDHIRKVRNRIAHASGLFERYEVQFLFKLAQRWLSPLGINPSERVMRYRKDRPRFLEALEFGGMLINASRVQGSKAPRGSS